MSLAVETETQSKKTYRRYREVQPADTVRRIVWENRMTLKEIALSPGIEEGEMVVHRWLNQSRDIPARKMPALFVALHRNMRLWSCLLDQCDLIAMPKPTVTIRRSPARILGEITLSQATIFQVSSKIFRMEKITVDEVRQLREQSEKLKQSIDEMVAIAEKLLQEQQKGEKQ